MRTLFVWDIHWCYNELMLLMQKIQLTSEDMLYFVGDMINKWPKSKEVIDWIRNRPNTFAVTGNHEFFGMRNKEEIEALTDVSTDVRKWNAQWRGHFDLLQKNLWKDNVQWLRNLPTYIETDDWILIHGGIHPDFWLDTPTEIATIIRDHEWKPWYEYYTDEKPIIYGHWAVDGLRIRSNTIGLDTGCCFGGHLTAYCFETGEIWQEKSLDVYKIIPTWRDKIERL